MDGLEILWAVYDWLPLVFALDVLLFHAIADHPLALRWWRGRARSGAVA